jgi:Spy/CpxP family protein refolding chaperone
MNIRTLAGAFCAALLLCTPQALQAQSSPPSGPGAPAERPGKPYSKKHGKPGGPAAPGLPPEEAMRLSAAREKAKADPTVRSLKEAREALDKQLENAVNAAILAADPGLAPVLEKVKQSRDRAKGMRDRFESLTPEQREQLKSARQAAKDDPEVVAAREKMKSADSPEARREAGKAMREAMKAAMLKQDPSLGPLLEQLGPRMGGPDGPGGRPGGPMGPPPGTEDGMD